MWKVLQAVVLFATAALIIARDFFAGLGIEANPTLIAATGLGMTVMLMFRSVASMLVMLLFAILMKLSDEMLASYNLDRDMLMAGAICLLLLPWIQRITGK